jgi:hypothetical protein
MLAYNLQALDNRDIQQDTAEALSENLITPTEYEQIKEVYPATLYTPNIFIRIGLFLLTLIVAACGLGLTFLMGIWSMWGGDRGIGIMPILWGVFAYGALEFFIHTRKMFRAGVDDSLLWAAASLVWCGIEFLATKADPVFESGIVLAIAALSVLRYADRLMALVAYGALINLIFHLIIRTGSFGITILPFIVMAVSIILSFLFARLSGKASLRHYRGCLSILRVAALLSFYLSGNYYIVQNINASIHGDAAPIALSWLWWGFTVIVPLAYIIRGIQKKDVILLWTGLALVAGAVFTIRYYHHFLPTEWAMIAAGSILVVGAYVLIRYLHTPKHGFTSAAPAEPHPLEHLPIESLILAETFQSVAAPPIDQTNPFGGGSGGGGGASGTY